MIRNYLESILAGLESLTLDKSCLSCEKFEAPLCHNCLKSWRTFAGYTTESELKIHFSLTYNEVASKIVMKAKESGIREAKILIRDAISDALLPLITDVASFCRETLIVPIPSTRTARRKRGEDFIFELAKEVSRKMNRDLGGHHLRVEQILKVSRPISDQTRLSELERSENLKGAFRVIKNLPKPFPIIVIDDVITSGSTFREAFRALKERNLTVLGGVTACASKRRLPVR